jgi:hypothetical protein
MKRPHSVRRKRLVTGATRLGTLLLALLAFGPADIDAQFSAPCELSCALLLGVTGYAVGTSTLVAVGRHTGGLSSASEAAWAWGAGFVVAVGAGMALSGDGERQERAVYGSGLGLITGSVAGLVSTSLGSEADGARRLAATLIGAGAGAVVGGVIAALTVPADRQPETPVTISRIPVLSVVWTP